MIAFQPRQTLLPLIREACNDGARLARACLQIGLSARTVQRWLRPECQDGDPRMAGKRAASRPPNKLSDAERQAALEMLSSDEFKDLPPSQIVPRLADQGKYVASEATLYRLLRQTGQMTHRRLERVPHKRSKPRALVATQRDQIYCWDTQSKISLRAALQSEGPGIGCYGVRSLIVANPLRSVRRRRIC